MIKFPSVEPVMVPQPAIMHQFKKVAPKQSNFMDSFRPIYYFLRTLGLMPFSIGRNTSGNISSPRVNKLDAVRFVASIIIYSIATFISFKYVKFRRDSNTKLRMLVLSDNLHLTFGLMFCVLTIGMDMYNRFKLTDLLKKFTIYDKHVSFYCVDFDSFHNNIFNSYLYI